MAKESSFNREYWEKNIEGFSGFYDKKSEENIPAPAGISFFYKKVIFPMEKKYMYQRHMAVSDYIDKNVKPEMRTADIGCGSGVYVKKMIQKGAFVYAYDYAQSALELTKRNLASDELSKCEFGLLDISSQQIPKVDLAISIGVLPYVDNLQAYLNNILPHTDLVMFNYLHKGHFLNAMRQSLLKFLDVRKYSYHHTNDVLKELEKHNFTLIRKIPLATGFIIEAKRK
jgi:2-polyprenyl-3-methyl-5-hydroxy-6-metoxy-1,4-benzoquinol methylase